MVHSNEQGSGGVSLLTYFEDEEGNRRLLSGNFLLVVSV